LKKKNATALFITRNLPPLVGGMERLNYHIALALDEYFQLIVVGPAGCKNKIPDSVRVFEISLKPLWRFLLLSGFKTFCIAIKKKPDFVIAGSGLTGPFAWAASCLAGSRSVVYLHGLDIIANHPLYRFLWKPFFRRIDIVIVNSRNTASLARKVGISPKQITVINPGTEMPGYGFCSPDKFRNIFVSDKQPLLLSVGRLTRRKGLIKFVENVLPGLVKKYPEICLVLLGDEAPNALIGSAESAGKHLDRLAAQLGVTKNLVRLGTCDDLTLSSAYIAADVHIFPVIEIPGDVEGFGMVALEAAAHGLPTVAFRTGGIPDAVSHGMSGYLVKAGDYHAMEKRVNDILEKKPYCISPEACQKFATDHTWTGFNIQLKKALGLIEKTNGTI
jgi:phosphatidyl-myo-inositol dimannoside synthase